MAALTLALDWTPNPIHSGFFLAQARGYYQAAGLDVTFRNPADDKYLKTPTDLVSAGEVLLAICPSECVIESHYLSDKPALIAVATVLQGSASAFITLGQSRITRPRELDDRDYAMLGLPFELTALTQLIYEDGGKAMLSTRPTPKLDTWKQVKAGITDCTWVFAPVEGVEAAEAGLEPHLFDPHLMGIPYGYAPVIAANLTQLETEKETLQAFLAATARGYREAAAEPEAAIQALPPSDYSSELLLKMQQATAGYYLNEAGIWGTMKMQRWAGYLEWLAEQKCIILSEHKPSYQRGTLTDALYTNRFLDTGGTELDKFN